MYKKIMIDYTYFLSTRIRIENIKGLVLFSKEKEKESVFSELERFRTNFIFHQWKEERN